MKLTYFFALFTVVAAENLGAQIQNKLRVNTRTEAELQAQMRSASNCLQKCAAIFNVEETSASAIACSQGCSFCKCSSGTTINGLSVAGNPDAGSKDCLTDSGYKSASNKCFEYCKNYDWSSIGLCKDVVEPDKACIYGCVNALCQGTICTGCNPSGDKGCCWDPTQPSGESNGCQSSTTTYGTYTCSTCCPDCDSYQGCGCNNGADPDLCGAQWTQFGIPPSCGVQS